MKAFFMFYHPLSLLCFSHFLFCTHHSFLLIPIHFLVLLISKAPEFVGHERVP